MEEQSSENKKPYINSRSGKGERHNTIKKQNCLLKKLAEGKGVRKASEECGCGNNSFYRWKKYDEEFKAKYEEYFQIELEEAEELLKQSLAENPNLLQFFLKHRHPEYRVKQSIELNHTGLNTIEVKVVLPKGYEDDQTLLND